MGANEGNIGKMLSISDHVAGCLVSYSQRFEAHAWVLDSKVAPQGPGYQLQQLVMCIAIVSRIKQK